MKYREIWEFSEANKIGERRVYRRFLKLKPADFGIIKPYLKVVGHPLNPYETNYRSHHLWHHFHATRSGDSYEIHHDIINPNIYPWLTLIPHVIFEGLPYIVCKFYCTLFARDQLTQSEKGWLANVLGKHKR